MVKIAYMIQAHKNADAINRLIKKMDVPGVDFYVHIDLKSDIAQNIVKKENVYVLDNRVDVRWGHISQVLATINLMKAVKGSKRAYDYVWLISGQDYPIKNNLYIQEKLSLDLKANYIEIIQKNDERYLRYLKRNETWYPSWGASPKFVMRILRKLYNYVTGGLKHSWYKRKNYLGVEWAFGSQWFTITYKAMCYILSEVESKPYIKYYTNCICADESIFQTILFNSEYADTCCGNLLYVDWSEGKKNPKVLGLEDLEKLAKSDKLIARKFDENIPEEILALSED